MSSTFSASEAIDLLIRGGWSFNGVAEWVVVVAPGDRSGVWPPPLPPQLCLEGWLIFGQVEILGGVEGTGGALRGMASVAQRWMGRCALQ